MSKRYPIAIGPALADLTREFCPVDKIQERLSTSPTKLYEEIQNHVEDARFSISDLRLTYSSICQGATGYDMIFVSRGYRIREISRCEKPIEHCLDIGDEYPHSVLLSLKGKALGEVFGAFEHMADMWCPQSIILDVDITETAVWLIFHPKPLCTEIEP